MSASQPSLIFTCNSLKELSAYDALTLFQLRQNVFILEQQCLYPDLDELDFDAWHVQAHNAEQVLVAYLRILAPGVRYEEPAIGRVAVDAAYRRQGFGTALLSESVNLVKRLYPESDIKLSAQTYTLSMYESVGFEAVGAVYLEDEIPHQAMVLRLPSERSPV